MRTPGAMKMSFLRAALLLIATIAAPTAALVSGALANPLCGANSIYCYYSAGTITSTDSVASCSDVYYETRVISNASYDLIHGYFTMGFQPPPSGGTFQGGASVAAVDQYRVMGVPAATPLAFSAELDANLNVSGYDCQSPGFPVSVSASATLREGDSNQSSASITTPVTCSGGHCCALAKSLQTGLRVVVTRSAGDPFTLHFDLATSGRGAGDVSGQLHFSGLPPGASVVSCQGYHQDFPTGAKGISWGRLKTTYR